MGMLMRKKGGPSKGEKKPDWLVKREAEQEKRMAAKAAKDKEEQPQQEKQPQQEEQPQQEKQPQQGAVAARTTPQPAESEEKAGD